MTPLQIAHFWSKVDVSHPYECWGWRGNAERNGYGRMQVDGSKLVAHRIAYQLIVGPIDEGNLVLHSCDNRLCCNPNHLRQGTHQDNMEDMVERRRSSMGAKNGRTKLDDADALYILTNPDRMSGKALAAKFGVASSTISYIRNRRSWKYLVGRAGLEPANPPPCEGGALPTELTTHSL
jgi:hypothetical protein